MKQTFATALISGAPAVLPPPVKTTPWEAYLLQELKKMQQELISIKADLANKDEKILLLEAQLQLHATHPQTEDVPVADLNPKNTQIPTEVTSKLVKNVISELKEKDQVESNKKAIRVGGLPDDWTNVIIEEDEYETETDTWKKKLGKVVPFVDLGDPIYISIKGKQAVVRYETMEEKIAVMKQTKSLQDTKVWISDELTPLQLKNRSSELIKVREARKEGKWAVYRGGKAIIREFKNPIPPQK